MRESYEPDDSAYYYGNQYFKIQVIDSVDHDELIITHKDENE